MKIPIAPIHASALAVLGLSTAMLAADTVSRGLVELTSSSPYLADGFAWAKRTALSKTLGKTLGHISTFNYQECRKALMANLNNQQRGCFPALQSSAEASATTQKT